MLAIIIYGMCGTDYTIGRLDRLKKEIKLSVFKIKELGVRRENDIFIYFNKDSFSSYDDPVFIKVDFLSDRLGIRVGLRREVASSINLIFRKVVSSGGWVRPVNRLWVSVDGFGLINRDFFFK